MCYDMATLAELATVNGDAAGFTYGATPNNPSTWDANRMYGCLCDEKWTGYDCSLRICPFGDDPLSVHQTDEVQAIQCTDADGLGTIVFTYKQQVVAPLTPLTTTAQLKAALEALPNIGVVTVTVNTANPTDLLCTPTGNTVLVEFNTEHGDLPLLQRAPENIDHIDVTQYTLGTKENWECSGRGLCDRGTGECMCFEGFGSSDGRGGVGVMGDCGVVTPIVGGLFKSDISPEQQAEE